MPYTPVELRHVRVPRAFLGYKRSAVEALLKEVADNFETAWRTGPLGSAKQRSVFAQPSPSVEAVSRLRPPRP